MDEAVDTLSEKQYMQTKKDTASVMPAVPFSPILSDLDIL